MIVLKNERAVWASVLLGASQEAWEYAAYGSGPGGALAKARREGTQDVEEAQAPPRRRGGASAARRGTARRPALDIFGNYAS